jgi:asparagine synthetase B (glutamine-hydrolysing)
MPGITALSAPSEISAATGLSAMERKLWSGAVGLRRESWTGDGFACAVHTRRETSGVVARHGACLAFEGYLVDFPEGDGRALPDRLLDGFLDHGPAFLERLNGSFQIVVHQDGETRVFADPTGSRRLFYTADERGLFVAPEMGPLIDLRRGEKLDPANLVQFLVSGRFFAGQSLLPWVRQVLPGESLLWREGRLERRRHFLYEASAGTERPGLLDELGNLIERVILRAAAGSESPVVLLSGGYDSRYIFHVLARSMDDPRRLGSVLWGERMDVPGSDNHAAENVARRYGIQHLALPWRTEMLPEQFEEMFLAQSGMTEMVFTHSDELSIFSGLAGLGFRSAWRGDEVFGPKGGKPDDTRAALATFSMGRANDVAGSGRWLLGGGAGWIADHGAVIDDLVAAAPSDPSDLRDTIYGRERLPALLQHHNYHKLHFVEMINPFLDADLLRFWSALPRRCRVDKTLFREAYHTRIGDHLDVPIATRDNGADWPRALRASPALASWVRQKLSSLPEPLNRAFFLEQLDAVLQGTPEPQSTPEKLRVPAVRLVARAVVLGHWLGTWAA